MKEYEFIGKCVYLRKENALVISDLHIGYEESLNIAMPRGQYQEIIKELNEIFTFLREKKKEVREIIILGDLKHEFSRNINQEWNEIRKFFSFLRDEIGKRGKIILVRGNHDNFIESISSKYDVSVVNYYIENGNAFIHGDKQMLVGKNVNGGDSANNSGNKKEFVHSDNHSIKGGQRISANRGRGEDLANKNKEDLINNKNIKRVFLGHFHPAIRLEEGVKSEIYKCFLKGEWKGKEIIILPSFFPLIEGVDVAKEALEESNLAYKFDLRNFEVFVPVSVGEVLGFGRVRDVRRLGG